MRYFNESNFLETTKICFYELIYFIQTTKKKNKLNLVIQQMRHPDLPVCDQSDKSKKLSVTRNIVWELCLEHDS